MSAPAGSMSFTRTVRQFGPFVRVHIAFADGTATDSWAIFLMPWPDSRWSFQVMVVSAAVVAPSGPE